MYICDCCLSPFEEPASIVDEYLDCRGAVVPHYALVSPCCSAEFSHGVRCSICDEWFPDDVALLDEQDNWVCPTCDEHRRKNLYDESFF